jgi:hypothetical protein
MVMGKKKGNKMERDVAKTLSIWMFNDEHVLKRESTSGASKVNYCGDIIVIKQINWSNFPFLIETKTGYENFTPSLYQYTKVLEWFNKSIVESKQHNQWIIFLICQFLNQKALLFTNYQLDLEKILPTVIIPNQINGEVQWIYTYIFKDIIKLNFLDLFGKEITYR